MTLASTVPAPGVTVTEWQAALELVAELLKSKRRAYTLTVEVAGDSEPPPVRITERPRPRTAHWALVPLALAAGSLSGKGPVTDPVTPRDRTVTAALTAAAAQGMTP